MNHIQLPTPSLTTLDQMGLTSVLPAPLYMLQNGEIVRLECDGHTQTCVIKAQQIDQGMVGEFAVSPLDETLAYVVNRADAGWTLFLADGTGGNERMLFRSATMISNVHWMPNGEYLTLRLGDFNTSAAGGMYVLPRHGGAPFLIHLDNTIEGIEVGYAPDTWNDNGGVLLVDAITKSSHSGTRMIKDMATGALFAPPHIDGFFHPSGGVWDRNNTGLYVGMIGPQSRFAPIGLWHLNVVSGTVTTMVAPQNTDGTFNLVRGVQSNPLDAVMAFIGSADRMPDLGFPVPTPASALFTIAPDGARQRLLAKEYVVNDTILWSPNGDGVIVQHRDETNEQIDQTLWLTLDGAETVLPVTGRFIQWGTPLKPPSTVDPA